MLFDLLKKQFDLPAATVQFGDGERREHEIVGEEDEGFVLCGVTIFDAPQRVGVVRSTMDTGEPDGLIADQPPMPGRPHGSTDDGTWCWT